MEKTAEYTNNEETLTARFEGDDDDIDVTLQGDRGKEICLSIRVSSPDELLFRAGLRESTASISSAFLFMRYVTLLKRNRLSPPKAKDLLLHTNKKIYETGTEVGFFNTYVFRQESGLAPGESSKSEKAAA